VTRLDELDLEGAVLVEIDFQGWVLALAHEPTVVEHAVAVRGAMATLPRICTRYLDTAPGPRSDPDSAEARFVPRLEPGAADPVVTKHGKDAFDGTDLDTLLHGLNARTVVLTGLLTAHGIASAASSARRRGFDVIVVGPACADVTPQTHTSALDTLDTAGFIIVDS
jgi:nicotinamidase-related amidase